MTVLSFLLPWLDYCCYHSFLCVQILYTYIMHIYKQTGKNNTQNTLLLYIVCKLTEITIQPFFN